MRRLLALAAALALCAGSACLGGDDETASPSPTPSSTATVTPATLTPRPETPTATPTRTRTPAPTETPDPTPTPRIVPTLDEGGLPMKVLNYANPIVPGQLAFITLISEKGATCVATLEYSKQEAGPDRLQRKEISPVGQVDWTWKVPDSPVQEILVTAMCRGGGRQGTRQFTIQVEPAPS